MPIIGTTDSWVMRFLLVDATDDETAETGKTPTCKVCAVGATTFSDVTASASELQRGWYEVAITSAELGTEDGEAIFEAYDTGTDIYREKIQITDGMPASVASNSVLTGYRLSESGVNDIRDIDLEGDVSLGHAIVTMLDMLTAISAGGGGRVQTYRNRDDTLNRVTFANVQTTTGDRLVTGDLDFSDLDY